MLFSTSSSAVAVPRSAAVAIPSASTTAAAAPARITPQPPHPSLSVVFVRRPNVLQSALPPPPPAHVRTGGGGSPAIPTWMQANLHVRETGGSVNAISPIPSFRTTALGVVAANDTDLDLADVDTDADADLDLDFHLELASPTHAIPTPLRAPFSRTAGTCAGAPLPARSSSLTQLPRSQPIAIPQTRSSSWSQPWQPVAPPPPPGTAPALVRPQPQQQQQHRLPSHPGYPAPAAAAAAAAFPLRTTTPPSPTASTRRTSISAVNTTTNAEESSEDDGEHALLERGCGRAVAIPAQIDSRRSSAVVSPSLTSSSQQLPHHFAKHATDVDAFLRKVHEFALDASDASDSEEDLPFPWM